MKLLISRKVSQFLISAVEIIPLEWKYLELFLWILIIRLVNSFDEEMTLELAKRLEEDNYNSPFDGLKDWHLLRALAINRPELTTNYTHLLDQEPFDEN